jgi:Domain of unknown function (DUF4352)
MRTAALLAGVIVVSAVLAACGTTSVKTSADSAPASTQAGPSGLSTSAQKLVTTAKSMTLDSDGQAALATLQALLIGGISSSEAEAAHSAMTTLRTSAVNAMAASPDTSQSANQTKGARSDAAVGDAITLEGNNDGELMKVTVMQIVNNAKGQDEYSQPSQGKRFFALRIKLTNVGTAVYDDSPDNGIALIDTQDQQYTNTTYGGLTPDLGGGVKIAPGDARVGWMTFEVPKTARMKKL